MTAATVDTLSERVPTLADIHGLEHPTALRLADQLAGYPVRLRRRQAADAFQRRRRDLELYAALYLERWGRDLDVDRLERDDELANELLILAIA